jgi:hypothetical protein
MARDRGYGSGKPLSANQSRSRQRAAAGNLTKGGKKVQARKTLNKIAKQNPVTGFVSGGVSVAKLGRVADSLFNAGRFTAAEAVASRLHAKRIGAFRSKNLSVRSGKTPVENLSPRLLDSGKRGRLQSESVFPRAPKKGPMGQPDLGDLGAGRVGLPYNTPAQIRRTNRARQSTQQGTRVTELEKRLRFPKRGR